MKKTNLIALIVFILAMVWVFTLENKAIRNIQSKVLGVFGLAHETVASVTFDNDVVNGEPIGAADINAKYEKEELAGRYSELLRELFELRAWQGHIDHLRAENIDLQRSLNFVDFKQRQNQHLIAARVIKRQSGSWWKTIVIDKGSADGVVIKSPIMTPVAVDRTDVVEGALVGKVTTVGEHQSTVVLVTDEECHVGAYVHGVFAESSSGLQRVQGILSGAPNSGIDVPYLVLRNLPKEADRYGVRAGVKVYSSGIENDKSRGVFPPGLILGYVKEFEVRDIDAEARVAPAIDFNALSYVFVLLPAPEGGDLPSAPRPPAPGPIAPTPVAPRPEPVIPRASLPGEGGDQEVAPPATPAAIPVVPPVGEPVPAPTPSEEPAPRAEPIPRAEPVGGGEGSID